jgi:acetylglutamate kinase
MIALNKTIRLFLDGIGRRDEYEFYLDKFQSERSACFALLCPDLGSIEAGAEVLAFDLHFLLRLELVPAILLCGPDAGAIRRALAAEPIFAFQSLEQGSVVEFIRESRNAEKVPVLVSETVSLEEALLALLPDVAMRVHFIRAAGGLKNEAGELLPYICTHKDNFQTLEKLEYDFPALGKKLLDDAPGVHVSITSPINLLQEIFTVKGAGTLFRKGSEIQSFHGPGQADRGRLLNLLETSFGKKLASEAFLDDVAHAYIEKNYRGAVLLEEHPAGLYLSKFAVGREARGEGLALELWREVCGNHNAFFWRSSVSNRFNSWYSKQADGYHISGKWQIFWRGVSIDSISGIIGFCCERDEDFQ